MESDPRSGRSASARTPENIERVRIAVNENRRLTARKIEEDLGILKTIVSENLSRDFGMSHVAAKYLPQLQSQNQKDYRVELSHDNLESLKTRHFAISPASLQF